MATRERRLNYHWGSGVVAEEARFESEHHVPAIQLLRYDEGEAIGSVMIRFCSFNLRGSFQRSTLLISESEIDAMRTALGETPELRDLLRRMVAE